MSRIYLSAPHMGGNERKYVNEAFDLNWIAPVGPHLQRFEESIAEYTGIPHVAALSSGTAAIHLALRLLNVQQDDEVICSTFTFSGSCNPIIYQKAKPIFVESEAQTWNMSPEFLEEAIKDRLSKGKKPKAIILVDLYGVPAQMDELMAIAGKYEIPVIEDAAEALGATYKGQQCGTFGDIGIFSFNGNKIITTSGGGALISRNEEYVAKAKFLATQARDQAPHYEHSELGYNYRLSNVSSAIGIGQMEVLDERVQQRRQVYSWYRENLPEEFFEFLEPGADFFANRWLTTVLLKQVNKGEGLLREAIRERLEKDNIECRPLWKPMHLQPFYKDAPYYGDGFSAQIFEKGLCLPSGSYLSEAEVVKISKSIFSFII